MNQYCFIDKLWISVRLLQISLTARKAIFSFSGAGIRSFLYYRERWYFFFPKIWSYTLDGKWKMIFLKKHTDIWCFLQAHDLSCIIWKDGIFSQKHDLLSRGRKRKTALPMKYMETWCIAQRKKKTGNLILRVEVWPLLKFIRLEIFHNE